MRDYNFFSYIDVTAGKKTNPIAKWSILSLAVVAVAYALTFGVQTYYRMMIASDKNQIAQNKTKYDEMTNLKKRLELGQKYLTYVQTLDKDIAVTDIVNNDLLDKVSGAMPRGSNLTSLALSGLTLKLKVTADSLTRASELILNLGGVEEFSNIVLNNVTRDNAVYVFNITADVTKAVAK